MNAQGCLHSVSIQTIIHMGPSILQYLFYYRTLVPNSITTCIQSHTLSDVLTLLLLSSNVVPVKQQDNCALTYPYAFLFFCFYFVCLYLIVDILMYTSVSCTWKFGLCPIHPPTRTCNKWQTNWDWAKPSNSITFRWYLGLWQKLMMSTWRRNMALSIEVKYILPIEWRNQKGSYFSHLKWV